MFRVSAVLTTLTVSNPSETLYAIDPTVIEILSKKIQTIAAAMQLIKERFVHAQDHGNRCRRDRGRRAHRL